MNIGIIYYSQTGHTQEVAQQVAQALLAQGHLVHLTSLAFDPPTKEWPSSHLHEIPPVTPYDLIILGAPVQAFRLALPMQQFLTATETFAGKEIYVYLTKQLPPFFGGKKALQQMKDGVLSSASTAAVSAKAAAITKEAIIQWPHKEQQIPSLLSYFAPGA